MNQLTLWPKPAINKKKCPRCGQVKTLTQFGRDKSAKSGIGFYCLDCDRAIARKYYLRKIGKPEDTPYKPYNPENRRKGAKRIDEGYVFINCGNGEWKAEHRLIMEKYLKRPLQPGEQVHHINGVKTDNQLDNLFVFNRRDHSTGHMKTKLELAKTQWQLKWLNIELQRVNRELKRQRTQNKQLSQIPFTGDMAAG